MTASMQLRVRTSRGISPTHAVEIPSAPTGTSYVSIQTVLASIDPDSVADQCVLELIFTPASYEAPAVCKVDGEELSDYELELIRKLRQGTDNEEPPEYKDWE